MHEDFKPTPIEELFIALARAETQEALQEVEKRALEFESDVTGSDLKDVRWILAITAIQQCRQAEGLAILLQEIQRQQGPARSSSISILAAYVHLIPPCAQEELFSVLEFDEDPLTMGEYLMRLIAHLGPEQIPVDSRVHRIMECFFEATELPPSVDLGSFAEAANQYFEERHRLARERRLASPECK
jgi:hypothetical protein